MDFHGYVKCYVFWKGESAKNQDTLYYLGNFRDRILVVPLTQLDFSLLRREMEREFDHHVFNWQA